jgi:transposase
MIGYPKETRAVRDALRRRQLFVRRRTQVILSLGGLLERYGLPSPSAAKVEKWTGADIQATGLDDWVSPPTQAWRLTRRATIYCGG